jgi:hypothetical protein
VAWIDDELASVSEKIRITIRERPMIRVGVVWTSGSGIPAAFVEVDGHAHPG